MKGSKALPPVTRKQWEAAVKNGFSPDGSTFSPDTIYGIRIGITSTDFRYASLPACRHDLRYHLGGDKHTRKAADVEFLEGLLRKVSILEGFYGWRAWIRCRYYYWAVRLFGARHFNWH